MFVCVCNAVTERDIGRAVAEGCRSLRELRQQLGVGADCGRCCRCAHEVLKEALPSCVTPTPTFAAPCAAA